MIIFPRRPARCAPETNPAVGARKARACPNRRSAREQARAFHAHFHTTMFICLFLASDYHPLFSPSRRSFLFV